VALQSLDETGQDVGAFKPWLLTTLRERDTLRREVTPAWGTDDRFEGQDVGSHCEVVKDITWRNSAAVIL
jgi:hypothetical protein